MSALNGNEEEYPREEEAPPAAAPALPRAQRVASHAPSPRGRRFGCAFWGLLATTILFAAISLVLLVALGTVISTPGLEGAGDTSAGRRFVESTVSGNADSDRKILLIPIHGIIMDTPSEGFMRTRPGVVTTVHRMLSAAKKDASIKAVILRIDSPGGGITASDVLYHEIETFRKETGKPVVALLGDVAASGGYYVAAAAEHIVAHSTTVTGSIGVMMPLLGVQNLLEKIGVEARVIKSGELKDIGSMYRPMNAGEREMLQGMVDEYHGIFVSVVHQGFTNRGKTISRKELRKLCDGRVLTGNQAKRLGFVDALGYYEDAVNITAKKAAIPPADVHVVTYVRRPGLLDTLLINATAPQPGTMKVEIEGLPKLDSPRFMYLWTVNPAAASAR